MSYCPNCGREILDESLGCPVCGVRNNIDYSKKKETEAEPVTTFTVEDADGTKQRFESGNTASGAAPEPVEEQKLHPALKVMIVVLILVTNGLGAIAGIVGGIALMKSPFEDYRRFGKGIMILGIVLLALSFLCCVIAAVGNGLAYRVYF